MKTCLVIISIFFCNFLFSQTKSKLIYDTTTTAIIEFERNKYSYYFDSTSKITTLTQQEFNIIDSLIPLCIYEHNKNVGEKKWDAIDYIKVTYKKQIVAALNEKNEKIIWINFFCFDKNQISYHNWKHKIIRVRDGGRCFFNFKINLTERKAFNFIVNDSV